MSAWPQDELRKIAESDDLHIAPFREDGVTYGTPTWIWSVTVDGTSMCGATTGRNPVGIKPPYDRKRVASSPPE